MKLIKKIALGSSAVIAMTLLAACGKSSSSSDTSSKKVSGDVKLWVDTTQVSYYKTIVKNFNKKYPDVNVKVTQSPNGSANAKTDVGKDPAKAADVFEVPNDQLGSMADQGYINPLSPDATKTVKSDNVATSVKGVTWKNQMYGYPFAEQAQTLYYNKSKLSAEDVKSWDTLTSKATLATDFTNAYNFYPIFFSAGTNLYGKNGETLKGTNVANQKGINALTWLAQQKSNKNVMQTSNTLNQLKSGNAAATIDGPWNTANIKKILGKNFGVAKYPTIKVGGKNVQMKAFLGIEAFAVNSHTPTKDQKAASTLAQFITNKQSQLIVYKQSGQIPVDKSAQKSSTVANDKAAQAIMTMAKPENSVLMPKMSQMATFWNLSAPLLNGSYTGSIKASDYSAKLKTFQDAISKKN
ncbi:extracellular solute-binding protein [Lacticaseibacillus pabuli]|uniref:Extracellular solute-binding protein n=1 Tax=Lacticaseibacillus pabuli TaxID=3025672 RepID=A0ABY7WQ23_9LACO|nr:extracellular solute-binding protein [Lacticaseibacillus sp. KACC 23028]WDF82274.1 extracellular solute-binding protein [Lacticaseibacillus sp. KACC 23028]